MRAQARAGALNVLWFGAPGAVPALARNIHRRTQREPDLARRPTDRKCFISRAVAERRENEITQETAAKSFTELIGNGTKKLAAGHRASVTIRGASAQRQLGIELGDQVVGQRVGNRAQALNNGQTVAYLAHNERDRGVKRVSHRRENLA